MGGTSWQYFVPYQADIRAAVAALQEKVFQDGDYYWAGAAVVPPIPLPGSAAELMDDAALRDSIGTHSIMDIETVVLDERHELSSGQLGPLPDRMLADAFPDRQPGRAGVEEYLRDRPEWWRIPTWQGYFLVTYAEGRPDAIAIWGSSGD